MDVQNLCGGHQIILENYFIHIVYGDVWIVMIQHLFVEGNEGKWDIAFLS